MIRAMPSARAGRPTARAMLRCLGYSATIAIAAGAGAWVQDARMRDHYIREGQISATYDAIFDGYWLYLGCISDDCAHEKQASDFIVRRGDERLRNGGKWVNQTRAQPLDPKDQ